jgi:trigger factor
MAPMGIVKKMVGKAIFVDEINKLASDSLYNYLKENDIDILGEPLPSNELNAEIDFDQEGDFTFHFDLGLAPEFELNFSAKDTTLNRIKKIWMKK